MEGKKIMKDLKNEKDCGSDKAMKALAKVLASPLHPQLEEVSRLC